MKQRNFNKGDLVCLLKPDLRGDYETVIFMEDLSPPGYENTFFLLLDTNDGSSLIVSPHRVVSVNDIYSYETEEQ